MEERKGIPYKKIRNVNLDRCDAPQVLVDEGGYRYLYGTTCAGENRYISIVLIAEQQSIIEKYKSIYDAVIASFRFNQFSL